MLTTGWTGSETELVYWASEARLSAPQLWTLWTLLGLGGSSVSPLPKKLGFFSEMELNHLVEDETWGVVYKPEDRECSY